MSSVPLCKHIKINGKPCGAPALKHRRFCYFHDESRMRRCASARRAKAFVTRHNALNMPILEDANAVQVGLMETINALIDARITERQCGLILYALQTASANLKHTTFETDAPKPPEPWAAELLTLLRALPDDKPESEPDLGPPPVLSCRPRPKAEPVSQINSSPETIPQIHGVAGEKPHVLHAAQSIECTGRSIVNAKIVNRQSPPLRHASFSFAPSASSALISSPADGTMARSPDRAIPHIHAVAEQKDEPVIPSGAAISLSAPQSARSRRSRGTCILPPRIRKLHADEEKPHVLHAAQSIECTGRSFVIPKFAIRHWFQWLDGPMTRWHDGTIP